MNCLVNTNVRNLKNADHKLWGDVFSPTHNTKPKNMSYNDLKQKETKGNKTKNFAFEMVESVKSLNVLLW